MNESTGGSNSPRCDRDWWRALVAAPVATVLSKTVKAARVMGATAIITGLSAEVAQVLVGLGVELADLDTAGDLRSGLVRAERLLSPASPPEAGRPAARHR